MGKHKNSEDWEEIEKIYRLGQISIRNLASEFGISHTTIIRRAEKEGWVQDKSEEIADRTRAALTAHQKSTRERTKKRTTPTRKEIDVAVETNIRVVESHRKGIKKGKEIVSILFQQLQSAIENRPEIEKEIEKETAGDISSVRKNMMLKAVSIPAHAAVVRDLSSAMKNFIPLDRQAYGIDTGAGKPESTIQEIIDAIDGTSKGLPNG